MNSVSQTSNESPLHMLNDKWVLYHHLPSNKDWKLSGYEIVFDNINSVEKLIAIVETIPEDMIKYSMWFFMRDGITPLWEDPKNESGGNFSYKIINKNVYEVWKQVAYLLCGGHLCVDPSHNQYINGITISPKKNFCIIKIWLNTNLHQDPGIITPIMNLTKHGSIFKKHGNDG